MRRLSIVCATAAIGLTALAAASPAQAAYHLIRWDGNGYCQVWDEGIPTKPFPADYKTVSRPVPTLIEALGVKEGLLRKGACTF
jgi:hypothetical protein